MCPMPGCESEDPQEHILQCLKLTTNKAHDEDINDGDLFSSELTRQAAVTKLFASLLERREDAIASPVGPNHNL